MAARRLLDDIDHKINHISWLDGLISEGLAGRSIVITTRGYSQVLSSRVTGGLKCQQNRFQEIYCRVVLVIDFNGWV